MNQFPAGWNRWRVWISGGPDDFGWWHRSVQLRLTPRHRSFEIRWGFHDK